MNIGAAAFKSGHVHMPARGASGGLAGAKTLKSTP
jgi:hypothetical protein